MQEEFIAGNERAACIPKLHIAYDYRLKVTGSRDSAFMMVRRRAMLCTGVPMSTIVEKGMGIGDVISLLWFERSLPRYCIQFIEARSRYTICLFFKVPMKVLQNVESIRARFFNGADVNSKKPSWVRWKSVLPAKDVGGLGNSLWVRVVKALHGEDEKIGKKVQPRYPSTWLNIINEIESLKLHDIDLVSLITPKLGNGINSSFWDVGWCGDIAFKNLVPRLYALESMKNIEVASKLSHGGLKFSFRRNPRGGVEQAQFERKKWHLFFTCKMISDVMRKITRWWDLEYRAINSFEDWCQWILSIRLPVKQKHVFEGICYIVWWYTWNRRNLKIFGQEDPSMVNVYDEVVYRSFYWIRFRCKAKFNFID
nr:RNA-directed DNA polymerase, eukaryota, reverse transcriptase zinc-binding domain protein [Tanacetum cinerariifolium]